MLIVLGLILSAVFAGVALYVLLVEHPARSALDPAAQLAQWKPSYHRGTFMQAGAAAAGGLVGIAGWLRWSNVWMLAGGALLIGAIAYTFAVMWALNGRIKATEQANAATVALLERWGRLHGIRTAIGLVALACFAVAAYRAVSA